MSLKMGLLGRKIGMTQVFHEDGTALGCTAVSVGPCVVTAKRTVEKHGYDVAWFNPINGEWVKQKKEFKGEKFLGEPPDRTHDWVLRLSRESKKESMLKSLAPG